MSIKNIIIGVDLDGVCANFYGHMRAIAAEWFECNIADLPTEVSYGLSEWGITSEEQYASLHRFAVTQRDLYVSCPMIPGARKYLRILSDQGALIRVITHRLFIHYFHNTAVSQTVDWLDKNGIPYGDLCFMKAKEQVGANIYIEDNPSNVEKLRQEGLHTICFGNSTNTHVGPPRAESWKDVYELVHQHFDA